VRLCDLLAGAGGARLLGDPNAEISSIAHDSRKVEPGGLFIALPGSRTDGNRHLLEAFSKGARAVMSELPAPAAPLGLPRAAPGSAPDARCWVQVPDAFAAMGAAANAFYGDPSSAMTVVGVTGTNGKTTVSYFLESIFSRCGKTPGVIGTITHRLAHRALEKSVNTTPNSLDLMALLSRMRSGGASHVAMEVSSHALAGRRVDEVDFDAAILTNLQRDHLDFHKTPEAYARAKQRLFELLHRAGSSKKDTLAVVNKDDPSAAAFARAAAPSRVLGFGSSPEAEVRFLGEALGRNGSFFRLRHAGREWTARARLLGRHNVANAAAAAAAALGLGLEARGVLEGIAALESVPGRLEPVSEGQPFGVLVDFAHTEGALACALAALRDLPRRRIITVFGCGGDRDPGKRGPMGAAACAGSDLVLLTSDNPRGEDPVSILAQIEEGIRRSGRQNYRIVPDRREAIFSALRLAQPEDIVLVAGKGHEETQILRGAELHFNDRQTVREALKELGWS
jgi:UDP-N-acetylmuramoyl-L-alanyl-D-glutamate--2,6-diaminopimelate ligase